MKHKTLITSALLICALLVHSQSIAQSATELAIDTVIKKYFVGINTQDTTLIKSMLAPAAEIKSVNEVGEIQTLSHDEYIDMLLDQQKGDFEEKIGYRHIWHDQEFAQAWMKYEFQIDDYLVHCGIKNFLFTRVDGDWGIVQITDTKHRQCDSLILDLETAIDSTADNWHHAAATSNSYVFFDLMTADATFSGIDTGDVLTKSELKEFTKPAFNAKSAWTYLPIERRVTISENGQLAWFEEELETSFGLAQGTGVMKLMPEGWKIRYYQISVTVPNRKLEQFIRTIGQ